jgi:hypothetical protein
MSRTSQSFLALGPAYKAFYVLGSAAPMMLRLLEDFMCTIDCCGNKECNGCAGFSSIVAREFYEQNIELFNEAMDFYEELNLTLAKLEEKE